MKVLSKYILAIVPLMLSCNVLLATKALPKLQNFVNPNGTTITIQVMGDHIFGYKQTLDGRMVEIGKDGYLHYVNLTPNGKQITTQRVGAQNGRNLGNFSLQTIQSIRELNKGELPPHSPAAILYSSTKSSDQEVKYPVILVEFEDVKFSTANPKESFSSMLNANGYSINGATGSAAEYLNANFKGYRKFSFVVTDVISLPVPIAHYGAQKATRNDTNPTQLLIDACTMATEKGLNLSIFDHDNDGTIENVAIIFAGHSEAEGGSPDSIWPHQTNTAPQNISFDGVKINSYSCSSELAGAQGDRISPIGTFCHEFLHSLGLPDLYDTNGEEEGLSPALYGTLSIMDGGNFLNNGNTPPYLCAIERELLGIVKVETLLPDNTYSLPSIPHQNMIYKVPAAKKGEYFLLECREAAGWDKYIGGSGMVVYHIDKSSGIYGGLKSSQRWEYNNINSFAPHECAKVLPAIGEGCSSDGIFFPGMSNIDKLVSYEGNTRLVEWDGYAVGIGLKNISYSNGKISFSTIKDYSFNSELPTAGKCKVYPMQRDAFIEWEKPDKAALWMIEWKKSSDEHYNTIITDTVGYCIRGLESGCDYDITVKYFNSKEYGLPAIIRFTTMQTSSPFPYIYIRRNSSKKSNKMDLRVFNLPEDATSVTWYINGEKIATDSFVPDDDKDFEIEVEIRYTDASIEKIYKRISMD